jgi:hypothetical protein
MGPNIFSQTDKTQIQSVEEGIRTTKLESFRFNEGLYICQVDSSKGEKDGIS